MFKYQGWNLTDAMDTLCAHSHGATDSGVADEGMKDAVREHLRGLGEEEYRLTVSRHVRERYLSQRALEQGYGFADAQGFLEWLDGLMA